MKKLDQHQAIFTKRSLARNFSKERLTLNEAMGSIGASFTGEPYIRFDPEVKAQYQIIRGSKHDGTMTFELDLIKEALMPLMTRTSCFKPEQPRGNVLPVYTVGAIKLATVYGRVDLPVGNFPGLRQRIRVPVRVDWVPAPGGINIKYEKTGATL